MRFNDTARMREEENKGKHATSIVRISGANVANVNFALRDVFECFFGFHRFFPTIHCPQ